MNTTTPTTKRPASPMRLLTAFIAAKTRYLAASRDEGGLFDLRFMLRLVDRERVAVHAVSAEATTTEQRSASLLDTWRRALADGRLTPAERRDLERDIVALRVLTGETAEQLRQLV